MVLLISAISELDAHKLYHAIFRSASVEDEAKVPLVIRMGDRIYSLKSLGKISGDHLRRDILGIPGVKVLESDDEDWQK